MSKRPYFPRKEPATQQELIEAHRLRGHHYWLPEEVAEMKRLRAEGLSSREIAIRMGLGEEGRQKIVARLWREGRGKQMNSRERKTEQKPTGERVTKITLPDFTFGRLSRNTAD